MDHLMWEEDARRWTHPVLFTPEAWATLTESQRAVVTHRRRAVVGILQTDHERRYHSTRNLQALMVALDGPPDDDV
jgi:hypothetical protein